VLQHVPDPAAVALELRRILRPGGAVAVIEVDGQLWGLAHPYDESLSEIHARAWRNQARHGGNRFIGRRLYRILDRAGFGAVDVQAYSTSSATVGLAPFDSALDPTALFPLVAEGVLTPAEYRRAVDGYERFVADPEAFVLFCGLMAIGRR
jgi:hypothetical protein